jgi:hypothetical protein
MRLDKLKRRIGAAVAGAIVLTSVASPGHAYLYWTRPDFSGAPVRGDEPGIALPLPGATPTEIRANLVWTMRAALNVAALQCQFAPPLMTVRNYNSVLSQHAAELNAAYKTVGNYFKRTLKRNWQRPFDEYSTRTYNGLSTMHAQIGFCETAGKVGRLALGARKGSLHEIATGSMREIRNSLVPTGDSFFAVRALVPSAAIPPLEDKCWDRKGNIRKKCWPSA